jgi:hypothetical protein
MNPVQAVLRRVDRYQQRHALVGVPFAVVRKFGDDRGGNLSILLAWNAFFAPLPLLLVLVTLLGYLLGRQPALQQRVLHSAFAEFPILGTQLAQNVHSLRANGFGLVVGFAGSLWGARGITQAGQYAMAEIWNIPTKERPASGPVRPAAWPCCWCSRSGWSRPPCSPGWEASAAARPPSASPTWPPPAGSTSGCAWPGSGS